MQWRRSLIQILGATGQLKPDKAFGFANQYSDKALKWIIPLQKVILPKQGFICFMKRNGRQLMMSLQKALQLNPAAIDTYRLLGLLLYRCREKRGSNKNS